MEHIAPLIQTVLWVALIGGIVWRFHRPIHALLTALQKRVEQGSAVKAGPFELGDLRPQEAGRQREKLLSELELVPQVQANAELPPLTKLPEVTVDSAKDKAKRTALLLQSEDLALRAIQADYGQALQRQVTAGSDPGFDGVFTNSGRISVVEVKFIGPEALLPAMPRIQKSLERLVGSIGKYGWTDPRLILVIVFEREEDVPRSEAYLVRMVKGLPIEVVIRVYSLPDLRRRFGLGTDDA